MPEAGGRGSKSGQTEPDLVPKLKMRDSVAKESWPWHHAFARSLQRWTGCCPRAISRLRDELREHVQTCPNVSKHGPVLP